MTEGQSDKQPKIGLFHMLRDVLVAAIFRGQFPLALFGGVILTIIWSLPQEDLSKSVIQLHEDLIRWNDWGWMLTVLVALGWRLHLKFETQVRRREVKRIADEKTKLQTEMLGGRIESSEAQQQEGR